MHIAKGYNKWRPKFQKFIMQKRINYSILMEPRTNKYLMYISLSILKQYCTVQPPGSTISKVSSQARTFAFSLRTS
jgi:hypothetical protein